MRFGACMRVHNPEVWEYIRQGRVLACIHIAAMVPSVRCDIRAESNMSYSGTREAFSCQRPSQARHGVHGVPARRTPLKISRQALLLAGALAVQSSPLASRFWKNCFKRVLGCGRVSLCVGQWNCGFFVALVHLWHLPLPQRLYRSAFALLIIFHMNVKLGLRQPRLSVNLKTSSGPRRCLSNF